MMGEKIISKQTEKEKMLAGELYFAMDEELWREHNHAQNILMKFNNSPDENRSEILKELFGKTGENLLERTSNKVAKIGKAVAKTATTIGGAVASVGAVAVTINKNKKEIVKAAKALKDIIKK